jgi:hypothetical protein
MKLNPWVASLVLGVTGSVILLLGIAPKIVRSTPDQTVSKSTIQLQNAPKQSAEAGNSFKEFKQRLHQAVRDRDAAFIRQIAAPDIVLGLGLPTTLDDLEIDDPDAIIWQHFDRILSLGCNVNLYTEQEAWNCPPYVSEGSLNPNTIYIMGEGINVRTEPNPSSPAIAVLSNTEVERDPIGYSALSEQQRAAIETVEGWMPIVTPDGQRGYISSRYMYYLLGHRATFSQQKGEWKMTSFVAGD